MKTMAAGEFKARCLKVVDQVRATREPVLITKRGRPVAKLVPAHDPGHDVFGALVGTLEIVGDVESPVVSADDWNAVE
ncbi:MAG: type II toxin-antitoxin system Phd/YefM family antitoxin [Candidatus Rokuibacteriota bacterium]